MGSIIIAIILIIVGFVLRNNAKNLHEQREVLGARIISMAMFAVAAVVMILACTAMVPTGTVGVQVLFGKPLNGYLETGLNFISPLVSVHEMTIQTQQYTMSAKAKEGQVEGDDAIQVHGNDQLTLMVEATVLYHIDKDKSSQLYQGVGDGYVEKIVRPESRSAITTVATSWSGIDLYSTHRQDYQDSITQVLRPVFAARGIILEQVLIRDVQPPQQLVDAINQKKQAQQYAEQMDYILQKEQKEAERKRIEAQGIADFQRIVSQGISGPLLQWKGIEATQELAKSQNTKVIVIGSGKSGLPLILGGNQ